MKYLLIFLNLIVVIGCGILPGKILSRQDCQQLDMKNLGYKDGLEASRAGQSYEKWAWSCKHFRVSMDRASYDEGYQQGLSVYCSCESGFVSGVRRETPELKGQFFVCGAKKDLFFWAHEQGRLSSEFKKESLIETIQERAKEVCTMAPQGPRPSGIQTHPKMETGTAPGPKR